MNTNTLPRRRRRSPYASLEDAFWSRVDKQTDGTGCWLWTGPRDTDHGILVFGVGNNHVAHRLSYTMHVGPLQRYQYLRHTCGNRFCVNPAHLALKAIERPAPTPRRKGRPVLYTSLEDAFWPRVDKQTDDTDCWLWTGQRNKRHGILSFGGGKYQAVHRLSYTMHIGPLRPDQKLRHTCGNDLCVNPAHLALKYAKRPAPKSHKRGRPFRYTSLEDSFWSRVDKQTDDTGCWLWTGPRDKLRRGILVVGIGKYHVVHRLSYTMHIGPLRRGQHVRHTCGNSLCVNPAHLALKSTERPAPKYRKRSDADVRTMREMAAAGITYTNIAARLGMDISVVSKICRGLLNPRSGGPLQPQQNVRRLFSPTEITEMLALRAEGMTLRSIGERFGVPNSSMSHTMRTFTTTKKGK